MSTNAVATRAPSEPAVFARLRAQVPAVARILDDEDTARRFIQLMLREVPKTPRLVECTEESIVGALMLCAQFRLEPGPQQHVYLIPRWSKKVGRYEANWDLGYRGMVELASRVGVQIAADVVKEHDHWSYWRSPDRDHFEHAPATGARGATVRAYAVARFPDGRPPLVHISDLEEIHRARDRSEQPDKAWRTDFDAMAMKTPVKRLFKWVGSTTLLREAAEADGTVSAAPALAPPDHLQIERGVSDDPLPITAQTDAAPAELVDEPELHDLTGGQHAQLGEWGVDDDVRHILVHHATGGRTASSKALTLREQDAFWTLAQEFGADRLAIAGDVLEYGGVEMSVDEVLEAAHSRPAEQPPLPAEPA